MKLSELVIKLQELQVPDNDPEVIKWYEHWDDDGDSCNVYDKLNSVAKRPVDYDGPEDSIILF